MEGRFAILFHPCLARKYGMDVMQESVGDVNSMVSASIGKYMQSIGASCYDDIKDMDDFLSFVEDSICLTPFVDEFCEDLNIGLSFTTKHTGYEGEKVLYISLDSYTDSLPETTLDVDKHFDLFDRSESIN